MINCDRIETDIFVGSCPASSVDIDRLAGGMKVTAILCLQSDTDFGTYHLPIDKIRDACAQHGVEWVQRPVIDFDPEDMAKSIHAPVDALNEL